MISFQQLNDHFVGRTAPGPPKHCINALHYRGAILLRCNIAHCWVGIFHGRRRWWWLTGLQHVGCFSSSLFQRRCNEATVCCHGYRLLLLAVPVEPTVSRWCPRRNIMRLSVHTLDLSMSSYRSVNALSITLSLSVSTQLDICEKPLNANCIFQSAKIWQHTVLPANKSCLPSLPSRRASPPFDWYLF